MTVVRVRYPESITMWVETIVRSGVDGFPREGKLRLRSAIGLTEGEDDLPTLF